MMISSHYDVDISQEHEYNMNDDLALSNIEC